MARGIKVPVSVNKTGGTAMVEGDDQAFQAIAIALSSGESANAFQQEINLGDDPIFRNDDTELRSFILKRVFEIFEDFEASKLFRLMRETIKWSSGEEGEIVIEFKFVNLESDKVTDFKKAYSVRQT